MLAPRRSLAGNSSEYDASLAGVSPRRLELGFDPREHYQVQVYWAGHSGEGVPADQASVSADRVSVRLPMGRRYRI